MVTNLLRERRPNEYPRQAREAFNYLTINGKYYHVGSARYDAIHYASDYDLHDLITHTNDKLHPIDWIVKKIQEKYLNLKPYSYITDFICGEDIHHEPIKWSEREILKGHKKTTGGYTVTLAQCLITKTLTRLTYITPIDGMFMQFEELYYIKIGNITNFDDSSHPIQNVLKSLKDDVIKKLNAGNYYKAIKRSFSWYALADPKKYHNILKHQLDFFNSEAGLLNKIRSDLNIVQSVAHLAPLPIIKYNLHTIANQLPPKYKYLDKSIRNAYKDNVGFYYITKELLNNINELVTKFVHDYPAAILPQ
jgi:hypothetical protein